MTRPICFIAPLLLLLAAASSAAAEDDWECDSESRRKCRRDAQEALQQQSSDQHCRSMKNVLNCLQWQSASCSEVESQDGDVIMRLWRQIGSFCDQQRGWYTRRCFQREEVRRCEALLPPGFGTDHDSCRGFGSFRSCASRAIKDECDDEEDRALLGTYLLDKGRRRAFACPLRSTEPLALHREDVECWEGAARSCRTEFDAKRAEARARNDSDMRNHITCCALIGYESCVQEVLRDVCGEERGKSEARQLSNDMRLRLPDCGDHSPAECSSSPRTLATPLFILLLVLVMTLIKQSKFD